MDLIKEIIKNNEEKKVTIKGWVVSNRGNNKIRFISVNDGSSFTPIQVVLKGSLAEETDQVRTGSAIIVEGEVCLTPSGKQTLEIIGTKIEFKNVDEDFPLQKQHMSREVLREIPHIRHRTRLLSAVFRIRSTLMFEIHNYFNQKGFINVSSPLITANDAEGAGEAFVVDSEEGNFFGKKASLSVSGQLHAEAFANGFGKVYTFAPTFRAEDSHTQKHVAEFWMLEPEFAFCSKEEVIKFADGMLKTIIKNTLKKHKDEFDFFNTEIDTNLIKKLNDFLEKGVQTITYEEAIEKLSLVKNRFEVQDIKFGLDLGTEHEKYIAEELFKGPVAVINYPKEIKAFYMKLNDDSRTVGAFDILVPGIGELIGGSERESDLGKLLNRMKEFNLDSEELSWYTDLRKYGQMQSTGFGLGFSRLLMYITGVENIRDVIPYPRTPNNLKV